MLKHVLNSLGVARVAAIAVLGCAVTAFADPGNKLCPIMVEDEIDPEIIVKAAGQDIALCCGTCEKLWKKDEKYYTKVGLELGLLPQLKGKEAELGLDKVELLKQRFCPFATKSIVTPNSPSVEYKGEKIYFFKASSIAKWNADPDGNAKKAVEAGLLPQLAGK